MFCGTLGSQKCWKNHEKHWKYSWGSRLICLSCFFVWDFVGICSRGSIGFLWDATTEHSTEKSTQSDNAKHSACYLREIYSVAQWLGESHQQIFTRSRSLILPRNSIRRRLFLHFNFVIKKNTEKMEWKNLKISSFLFQPFGIFLVMVWHRLQHSQSLFRYFISSIFDWVKWLLLFLCSFNLFLPHWMYCIFPLPMKRHLLTICIGKQNIFVNWSAACRPISPSAHSNQTLPLLKLSSTRVPVQLAHNLNITSAQPWISQFLDPPPALVASSLGSVMPLVILYDPNYIADHPQLSIHVPTNNELLTWMYIPVARSGELWRGWCAVVSEELPLLYPIKCSLHLLWHSQAHWNRQLATNTSHLWLPALIARKFQLMKNELISL